MRVIVTKLACISFLATLGPGQPFFQGLDDEGIYGDVLRSAAFDDFLAYPIWQTDIDFIGGSRLAALYGWGFF